MVEHPTETVIQAYCKSELDPHAVAQIELHLRECGECCRQIVAIVRQNLHVSPVVQH